MRSRRQRRRPANARSAASADRTATGPRVPVPRPRRVEPRRLDRVEHRPHRDRAEGEVRRQPAPRHRRVDRRRHAAAVAVASPREERREQALRERLTAALAVADAFGRHVEVAQARHAPGRVPQRGDEPGRGRQRGAREARRAAHFVAPAARDAVLRGLAPDDAAGLGPARDAAVAGEGPAHAGLLVAVERGEGAFAPQPLEDLRDPPDADRQARAADGERAVERLERLEREAEVHRVEVVAGEGLGLDDVEA